MGEFANKTRARAADALRRIYQQEATPGMDPVLELIGFLLEDGAGGVLPLSEVPVTTEQWLAWSQLTMERQQELVSTTTRVLEGEGMELPSEVDAMRNWAACLLLSTLDQMGMM